MYNKIVIDVHVVIPPRFAIYNLKNRICNIICNYSTNFVILLQHRENIHAELVPALWQTVVNALPIQLRIVLPDPVKSF